MTIESDLFDTLKPLVSNRVYPETFVQPSGGALPTWPAIRYDFISEVPTATICGDTGDDAPDIRVQLDVVDKGWVLVRALRLRVMAAMATFYPPSRLENTSYVFDETTKTYRAIMDYVLYKSTQAGSP